MSGSSTSPEESNTLWHGRFDSGPDEALLAFTVSLPFDKRLGPWDVRASMAHVNGLQAVGVLTEAESVAIVSALDQVGRELAEQSLVFVDTDEDVHTAIERRVTELEPTAGGKLHTGRSRNDQVTTAFRLWVKEALIEVAVLVEQLQLTLLRRIDEVGDAYLPGYTHLQRAQPVPLGHHLAAHAWALDRDVDRLLDCIARLDVSPLGAGALAGSSLPLNPEVAAGELGFASTFANSMDTTSDRDYVAETLFCLSLLGVHLSRMGEELVLWASQEFGFVSLDDRYATGSSMMPQKKNPDIAELIRGKAGRLIGNATGFLATLKGLPLSYNRDLQEDKEPLFDSVDQIRLGLIALGGMIETITFKTDAMASAADDPLTLATDLAEILVRGGLPFREAHAVVGALVRESLSTGKSLGDLAVAHGDFGPDISTLFEPGVALSRRASPGGAGFATLAPQLERLRQSMASLSERRRAFHPGESRQ